MFRQRKLYRKNRLSKARLELLESIKFPWRFDRSALAIQKNKKYSDEAVDRIKDRPLYDWKYAQRRYEAKRTDEEKASEKDWRSMAF